jgi:hypothetical protein
MNRSRRPLLATLGITLLAGVTSLSAQAAGPLAAGSPAPDFALPGATSAGPLQQPVRLSDLHGGTVVLAFFYKARTKG